VPGDTILILVKISLSFLGDGSVFTSVKCLSRRNDAQRHGPDTVLHLGAEPTRCSARAAPSVSNSGRGAVALRPSMPELAQLRLSWRGSYAPSHGGRAMNPLDLSRWGLWVISTGLGSFGVFCLYFSMLGAPVAGHAFIFLGTATAIALALEKIRPTGP